MPQRVEPPSWWNTGLYSFLPNMPIEGWIWEFARRHTLQGILEPLGLPVDAMNPNPDLNRTNSDLAEHLYIPWPSYQRRWGDRSLYVGPAVRSQGVLPRFRGQPIQLDMYPHIYPSHERTADNEIARDWVDIVVDLNRRDTVIIRDFNAWLNKVREKKAEPAGLKLRPDYWDNTLQAWDLRQYRIMPGQTAELLGIQAPPQAGLRYRYDKANGAYKRARTLIDEGKWKYYARYMDA